MDLEIPLEVTEAKIVKSAKSRLIIVISVTTMKNEDRDRPSWELSWRLVLEPLLALRRNEAPEHSDNSALEPVLEP